MSKCEHPHVLAVEYGSNRLPSNPHPRDSYIYAYEGCREPMSVTPAIEYAALRAAHAALGELLEAAEEMRDELWPEEDDWQGVETAEVALGHAIDKARAAYRAAGGETCDS